MNYYDDDIQTDTLDLEDEYRDNLRMEKIRRKKRLERRKRRRRQVMINRCIFGFICLGIIVIGLLGVRILATRSREAKGAEAAGTQNAENDAALKMAEDAATEIKPSGDGTADDSAAGITDDSAYVMKDESTLSDNTSGKEPEDDTKADDADYTKKSAQELAFFEDEATSYMGSDEMTSTYGILVNVDDHTVVSAKNAYDRISPASMTKILTLLVAAENITNLDDPVTITIEDTDFAYSNDCSSVGFAENETVTVKDLLYGTILPSGGDAAYALSRYVAGSHEAFAELMNERLAELGISDSAHFTNCVGLYDDDHYCNVYDMAVILEAAMENPLCRQVLSAHKYTTTATEQHPEGIDISNLFLRRIEDKDTLGEVIGAKTGYVVQSGNCAASYYTGNNGKNFICVTADAHSAWRCIYDHVAVYNIYAAGNTGYKKQ